MRFREVWGYRNQSLHVQICTSAVYCLCHTFSDLWKQKREFGFIHLPRGRYLFLNHHILQLPIKIIFTIFSYQLNFIKSNTIEELAGNPLSGKIMQLFFSLSLLNGFIIEKTLQGPAQTLKRILFFNCRWYVDIVNCKIVKNKFLNKILFIKCSSYFFFFLITLFRQKWLCIKFFIFQKCGHCRKKMHNCILKIT